MTDARPLPLVALRVLEACARHRNFTRAAEELGITPGAVTQHIRTLEEWAGAPLFIRSGRDFLLSEPLELASGELSQAFQQLNYAARLLRSPVRRNPVVSVSAPPSFAAKWLLPRLDGFRAIHTDVEIWVSADLNLVDFGRGDVDLAIRYGSGSYPGVIAEKLFAENVLPVAAPAYLEEIGAIADPADLARARLLHDLDAEASPFAPDWAMWFRIQSVDVPAVLDGPRYNQSSMVIDEAVAGKGIALARTAIAAADLESGRLLPVMPHHAELAHAYWLVWPQHRTLLPPARAFATWLIGHARDQPGDGPAELSGS